MNFLNRLITQEIILFLISFSCNIYQLIESSKSYEIRLNKLSDSKSLDYDRIKSKFYLNDKILNENSNNLQYTVYQLKNSGSKDLTACDYNSDLPISIKCTNCKFEHFDVFSDNFEPLDKFKNEIILRNNEITLPQKFISSGSSIDILLLYKINNAYNDFKISGKIRNNEFSSNENQILDYFYKIEFWVLILLLFLFVIRFVKRFIKVVNYDELIQKEFTSDYANFILSILKIKGYKITPDNRRKFRNYYFYENDSEKYFIKIFPEVDNAFDDSLNNYINFLGEEDLKGEIYINKKETHKNKYKESSSLQKVKGLDINLVVL